MTRSSSLSWCLCTWARCPAIVLRVNSDNQCDPKEGSWPIPSHTYGSNFQWNHKRNCRDSLQLSTAQDLAANFRNETLEIKTCTCKLGEDKRYTLLKGMDGKPFLSPGLFLTFPIPPKTKILSRPPIQFTLSTVMQLCTVPTLVSGSLEANPTCVFLYPKIIKMILGSTIRKKMYG